MTTPRERYDVHERALSAALAADAAQIEPSARLGAILQEAHDQPGERIRGVAAAWPRWVPALAFVAAAVLVAVVVWSTGRAPSAGPGPMPAGPGLSTGTASQTPTPQPTDLLPTDIPTTTGHTTITSVPDGKAVVAVYYAAAAPGGGFRLYREFHKASLLAADPVRTALVDALVPYAEDPDYTTLWPFPQWLNSLTVDGTVVTLDLQNWPRLDAEEEQTAVQQVVYTVTANNTAVTAVRFLLNGKVPPSDHLDLSQPIARAPALGLLANVWLLEPTQGATVGSPVLVSVYGTGFEGNIPLEVFRGSTLVWQGHVTTTMGGFAQASTTVTLAPGSYVVRAYNDNMEDGSLVEWDSKAFTVR